MSERRPVDDMAPLLARIFLNLLSGAAAGMAAPINHPFQSGHLKEKRHPEDGWLNAEDRMMTNVGMIDRVARAVVGLALIAFAIPLGFPGTEWNWIGWIGVIPLITAVAGYCPAYTVFGISSCPAGAPEH